MVKLEAEILDDTERLANDPPQLVELDSSTVPPPSLAPVGAGMAATGAAVAKGIFGAGDDSDDAEETEFGEITVFGDLGDIPIAGRRRVVFVMDVSRSLTPAQFELSKEELRSGISALPETALYQVIFFSGPTWFAHQRMTEGGERGEDVVIVDGEEKMKWNSGFGGFEYEKGNDNLPKSCWRVASKENIDATMDDIEAVGKSYGTTWHLPLTMAMSLEPPPKNIYFLTDGETARQDQVAGDMVELSKQRGGKTRINTIALMVPGASVPLHQIAKGTGGEYALVIAGGKILRGETLKEYLGEKDIHLND